MSAAAVVTRGMRVLGVVAALVLGGAGPLWGQDARVLGRVTDGVGNPVAEARVTLVPHDPAAARQETVSGQTGGFQFARVAPGTYTLRATRAGYTVQERRVTVRAGQVISHVVRLQRGRAAREVANALRPVGR